MSYWEDRFLALEQRQHNAAEAQNDRMAKTFAREYASLQKDVDAWYGRYATENGMSMADAKKQLTAGELAEFKWTVEDYTDHAKGNQSGEFTAQLNRVSERVRISRLEALQWQVASHADRLGVAQEAGLADVLKGTLADQYHRTAYEAQKGIGVGFSFAQYDEDELERMMRRPWAADGSNFSNRIWDHRDVLSNRLQQELERALIQGENPREVAKRIQKEFGVAQYQAERLVRTEMAHAAETAKLASFREMGVDYVKISAALDSLTCAECGKLDGTPVRLKDAVPGVTTPPYHPNCRCATIPREDDLDDLDEMFPNAERIARDEDGKSYYVPRSITYKEWAETFLVPPNQTPEHLIRQQGLRAELTVMHRAARPQTYQRLKPVSSPGQAAVIEIEDHVNVSYDGSMDLPLTEEEEGAILRYISSEAYMLNEALRNGNELSEAQMQITTGLNSALEKLPTYEGSINRSLDFYYPEHLKRFIEQHAVGAEVTYSAFTSFSSEEVHNESGNVQLFIRSKTGRDLRRFNPGESEILYPTNSRFRVLSVTEENGVYRIELEEVP